MKVAVVLIFNPAKAKFEVRAFDSQLEAQKVADELTDIHTHCIVFNNVEIETFKPPATRIMEAIVYGKNLKDLQEKLTMEKEALAMRNNTTVLKTEIFEDELKGVVTCEIKTEY